MMVNLYGIVFALSLLIMFFLIRKYFSHKGIDKELSISAMIYLILGIMIGARILYVIYYNPSANPIEIWKGGLSFHGGLIGALITGFIFCKRNKVDFLEFADFLVTPAALFLGLGRIANFSNSELYGTVTNVPWCVNFSNAEGCRHPTQIYSAIKNFFLFFFLITIKNKKMKKGILFLIFLVLYSSLRFFIDILREYQTLSGQYLNVITFLIAGFFLYKKLN